MLSNQQTELYLKQLQQRYPRAFKGTPILYSQIKTKGILDEAKEFLPWVIGFSLFSVYCCVATFLISQSVTEFSLFRCFAFALLSLMLFLMLSCPIIVKQIKHSSSSLYKHLQNTPLKLTALIVLQGLNIAYAESWIIEGILFFFMLSFGFVKLYKENMFKNSVTHTQYQYLQQIRRICFWSYKQSLKLYIQLFFSKKQSPRHTQLAQQKAQFAVLHTELINFENKLCLTHKHHDIEQYLDSIM